MNKDLDSFGSAIEGVFLEHEAYLASRYRSKPFTLGNARH